nr:hypothetical protein [Tanacetum cinerariifolium]
MHKNSQGKKQAVEDHRRSVKLSKNKTSVTAYNDSLNAKTLNLKSVSTMCDKCVLIDKHDMCVLKSVAKPFKEIVASESNKNPRNFTRKLYELVSKTCSWWYPKFTPLGYKWKPKSEKENVNPNLVEIVLFIVDSGCSKHMTENLKLLINFVEKFMGTVKFGNDQIAPILGYRDLVQGAVTIKRVYYVKGLNHNLLSVGQFCDADLEVAFRKSTDGENLDKMKEKGDECIFVGYSTQSRAYRVFNKRTRVIMESIHVNFDELPQTASDQLSSDPAPECQTMALNHDSLSPAIQRQEKVTQIDRTLTTSNELDLLFSPMFDELLNGSSKVVSKSFAISAADAPYQRQNHTTPLNIHTTSAPTCQVLTLAPTVISSENINQAETYAENDQVADDEFINIFSTPVQDQREMSPRHARLVAQGYNQQERIDYDETYASVARLESIRILLAYVCALDFKLFQMDFKLYVAHPPRFIDFVKPNHVYKLKKALYGLKQAHKACQYRLSYSDEGQMFVEFVIQNQYFSFPLEDFAQIRRIPCEGACVFSDRWSLDELVYGAPSKGPYQTNLHSLDDIILFIQEDQEERKPRKDRGMRRGRHSISSSTFNEPSSSHLNDDDDDDGNNEGTSRASTPSPIRYVNC